jgi:uncharacterized protein (DUF58 family)
MNRGARLASAGLLLLLLAFLFDAAPLFVPAIAFIVLGVGVPAWVWLTLRGASIARHLDANRVLEGEPFEATVQVQRGPLGLPGARVVDPMASRPVDIAAPMSLLRGGRTAQIRIVASFPRRGLRHVDSPTLVAADGLGLARFEVGGSSATDEVLVLPRIEPVSWSESGRGLQAKASGVAHSSEPLAAVDIDGLRPYREGTPASRIHWAALARGAGLLERRLQADGDSRPLVVLDARGSGQSEHLDAAIRAAASLVVELARTRGCGLLLPGERRPIKIEQDLSGWHGAHARMALIENGPATRAPVIPPGALLGALIYVAAQAVERMPAGVAGRARGIQLLVLPRELSARIELRPSFEVAGCYGFAIRTRDQVAA